jgi:signal transduction histidine kinase
MERLNRELRLTTRELALLLDLSNLLAAPFDLEFRLDRVLKTIVDSLDFPDAGLTLLTRHETGALDVVVTVGCDTTMPVYRLAKEIGQQCVTRTVAMCRHADGSVIEFSIENALDRKKCQRHASPPTMISLPLTAQEAVIGSIIFCRTEQRELNALSPDEFGLMVAIAQQLGLSIENARLYQEAQEREKLLGQLLHQAVGTQEAERQRIARELHDATGQSLTAIALGLRGAESVMEEDPELATKQIGDLKAFTADALGELRRFIADLRPSQLDDLGLVAALQWYIQDFEDRYGIETALKIEGSRVRLAPEYETVLFRITQEALTNVAKHANASMARVNLKVLPTQVELTVQDNGRGFDPVEVLRGADTQAGWGLLGIQERSSLLGGTYEIDSAPGKGTCVRVEVPLTTEAEDVRDTTAVGG